MKNGKLKCGRAVYEIDSNLLSLATYELTIFSLLEKPSLFIYPRSLTNLAKCEKLSLSTNNIEKIANLNGLKNLRILCLSRNNIKNLNGLDAVGGILSQLYFYV